MLKVRTTRKKNETREVSSSSVKQTKEEERFLTAQADTFAGANVKEKASACSVRNDGGVAVGQDSGEGAVCSQ